MAEPLTHQPFLALNANNNVRRIHPGVVKRDAKDVPLSSKKIREILSSKERAQREPDRALVDASQPKQAPSPEPPPEPKEAEPVATRKKTGPKKGHQRSPESIAKQKATLARKKRKKARAAASNGNGDSPAMGAKSAFVRAHPELDAVELVKLGKKEGIPLKLGYIYNVRSLVRKEAAGEGSTRRARAVRESNGPGSNGASIGDLLRTIKESTAEIERRLSALSL